MKTLLLLALSLAAVTNSHADLLKAGKFSDVAFVSGVNLESGRISLSDGETYQLSPSLTQAIAKQRVSVYPGLPVRFAGQTIKAGKLNVSTISDINPISAEEVRDIKGKTHKLQLPPPGLFNGRDAELLTGSGNDS